MFSYLTVKVTGFRLIYSISFIITVSNIQFYYSSSFLWLPRSLCWRPSLHMTLLRRSISHLISQEIREHIRVVTSRQSSTSPFSGHMRNGKTLVPNCLGTTKSAITLYNLLTIINVGKIFLFLFLNMWQADGCSITHLLLLFSHFLRLLPFSSPASSYFPSSCTAFTISSPPTAHCSFHLPPLSPPFLLAPVLHLLLFIFSLSSHDSYLIFSWFSFSPLFS